MLSLEQKPLHLEYRLSKSLHVNHDYMARKLTRCSKDIIKIFGVFFASTGVIPSSYGKFPERYFGFPGFSDFQGPTSKNPYGIRMAYKKDYRINVPAVMWTAACCEFEEQNKKSKRWSKKYITKAFWGENKPFNTPIYNTVAVSRLFTDICKTTGSCPRAKPTITIFPSRKPCNK